MTQQTRDVQMLLHLCRCDVITPHRLQYNIILASCWELSRKYIILPVGGFTVDAVCGLTIDEGSTSTEPHVVWPEKINKSKKRITIFSSNTLTFAGSRRFVVVVVSLLYVHGKQLRSCQDV